MEHFKENLCSIQTKIQTLTENNSNIQLAPWNISSWDGAPSPRQVFSGNKIEESNCVAL